MFSGNAFKKYFIYTIRHTLNQNFYKTFKKFSDYLFINALIKKLKGVTSK